MPVLSPRLLWLRVCAVCAGLSLLSACDRWVNVGAPDSSVVSPPTVQSYEGAMGLYAGTIKLMQNAVTGYTVNVGLFTDELNGAAASAIDARTGLAPTDDGFNTTDFQSLSKVRIQAQQAIGALARYPHQASPHATAEAYALEGMAEVLLTELFCNGIPLGKVPFGKDFQYSGAIATTDVLALAIAHFDTALTLGKDSAAIATLASVGKGRALLDLGRFADAASAVKDVPTDATYGFTYDSQNAPNTVATSTGLYVTDHEGINGLKWSDDPRVPLVLSDGQLAQNKYSSVTTPFILASGIEARLIEAEARLHAKDYAGWIGILQTLAQTVPGTPTPIDPGAINGNDSARVTVHFRERAYWLFLTGHRQGDMRRLMRQYLRPRITVAPVGAYTPRNIQYAVYGTVVVFQIPKNEQQNNPLYKGCIDRNP